MPLERTFRTESGTYAESELAVLVWINPDQAHRPNSRLLATMTDNSSPNPMAFPINMLKTSPELSVCAFSTPDSVALDILNSHSHAPAIVSLPLAREHLGWTDFYIPTKYVEPR
jgi:hypothetical protein